MRTVVCACFLLIFSTSVLAQGNANVQPGVINFYEKGLQGIGPDFGNNPASENFYNQMRDKLADLGVEQKLNLDDIDGSIYFNEQFVKGEIRFNGKKERDMYMRYNAFNDEFEIKNTNLKEDKALALLKNVNISCVLAGDEYIYGVFKDKKNEKSQGYLKSVLNVGGYELHKRNIKHFKAGKEAKTSHAVSFPHRFVDETHFYISLDDGVPAYISSKKRDFLSLFLPDHQQKIKQFMKSRNIDLKTEKGLVNVIAFAGNL
ncbi:hypothetical protein [Flagellimonas flava]|uniref:Uncharacterized protein n=1 Tax=Flagellimonas flava TaxID=570519 RepID=A0A1M5NU67_9FLAO|nr:hypothetical protein [Allomuricauda flava]SHG93101.1 hypothetical protein SAMN04488116_2980 [Allomuricauda flava]